MIHAKVERLNFLKQEVRYKKIAEHLSDKLSQSKIDNFQKILIEDDCSNIPNASGHKKIHIVNQFYVGNFLMLTQEPRIAFCQCFTNAFKGNTHSARLLTITNYPNIPNDSLQELGNAMWINTTNKWNNKSNTYTSTTSKWIFMASSAERKKKGKAPAQDFSRDKRLQRDNLLKCMKAHLLG